MTFSERLNSRTEPLIIFMHAAEGASLGACYEGPSYLGRATEGRYTSFLLSVRACHKGLVTMFEGIQAD